ncbi:MAG: RNA polymerase sigma-70 factor [Chitinophagaceae bacterium]|nr:RNA polymerase sigma-70 factor [Chitinophagaceae bacterium]
MQSSPELEIDNLNSFETVYKHWFKPLMGYAITILKDETYAEEMVQNVFVKLWEKKEHIDIHTSLQAYLYKSVYFESLNFIKRQQHQQNYETQTAYAMKEEKVWAHEKLDRKQLETKLRDALNDLPEQCRTVFQLSRFQELKYREIAASLGISEKTVENHMGKALRILRLKLAEFISLLIIPIIHFKNWFL